MPHPLSEAPPPPLTGDRVGRYLLGEVLGVGGMATVYAATDGDGGSVAVKVLHPGKTDDEEARRFRREFLTLRALRHPAIVEVHEAGRAGEYPWIAMERIPGTDLETVIQRWSRHPPADRVALVETIFRDICGALAHIHGAGLIHRDLKPSNVLITLDHRAKLTDFGVVKAPFGQFHTQLTAVGSLVGTAAYMSPEQISGDPVDGRSDLYSLGAVLYVMLTGQRPIVADTVAGYLTRHLHEAPRDPRELDPRVPARLSSLCLRLLAKDPAQRYATADQVLAALDSHEDDPTHEAHGRAAELATLQESLAELGPGRGGLVVVAGPPGSGRTTLIRKLVKEGRAAGHGISLSSAARPQLFEHLCAQIPSLGPRGTDGTPLERIAARTHGRPWTIVIDDLERAEPATLDQLTRLARQQVAIEGDALLVVVSTDDRPGPASTFASGATTGLRPTTIRLTELSRDAILRLLRDLGLGGAACTALARRFGTEGIRWPGAVQERLQALVREGWLQRDLRGALHLARSLDELRDAELPVPTRARDAIAAALEALADPARHVLDTLLVLGGESDPATLAEITAQTPAAIDRAGRHLTRAGFVEQDTVGLHPLLRLHPAHTLGVLYGLVPDTERATLHLRVARALQAGRGRSSVADIGMHLVQAGEHAEALPLLLKGATVHIRAGRLPEARALLDAAERSRPAAEAGQLPAAVQSLRHRLAALDGDLSERMGDAPRALAAWGRARAAAEAEGDTDAARRARAGIGVIEATFEAPEALGRLAPVWKSLTMGDPLWPVVTRALAHALLQAGRTRESRALWSRLAAMARDIGSETLRAESAYGAALVRLAEHDLSAAHTALVEAEGLLRTAGLPVRLAECGLQLAELALARGALLTAAERADEVRRRVGLPASLQLTAGALAHLCADAHGQDAPPSPTLDELAGRATEAAPAHVGTWLARAAVARSALARGATDTARRLLAPAPDTVWAGLDSARPAGLADPMGQLDALRARAADDPDLASADAWSALGRELPVLPVPGARIALDASHGLVRAGDPSAEDAIMEALDRTDRPELGLLRLEAAWLGSRIGLVSPDDLAALRAQVAHASGEAPDLSARWT